MRAFAIMAVLLLAACGPDTHVVDIDAKPGVAVLRASTGAPDELVEPVGPPGPAIRLLGEVHPGRRVARALDAAGHPVSGTFISRHSAIRSFCLGMAEALVLNAPLTQRQIDHCPAFAINDAALISGNARPAIYAVPRVFPRFEGLALLH